MHSQQNVLYQLVQRCYRRLKAKTGHSFFGLYFYISHWQSDSDVNLISCYVSNLKRKTLHLHNRLFCRFKIAKEKYFITTDVCKNHEGMVMCHDPWSQLRCTVLTNIHSNFYITYTDTVLIQCTLIKITGFGALNTITRQGATVLMIPVLWGPYQ